MGSYRHMAPLKDVDIRKALYDYEIRPVCKAEPDTRVIEEFGLMEGAFRVDVAVVNGKLHGYEIKSAVDNLDRLPAQQACYNMIFDKVTLVVDEKHAQHAVKVVPPWWGLIVAVNENGKAKLNEIWPSRQNHNVDPYAICQLLWRDEALKILRVKKIMAHDISNGSRKLMWKRLASTIELEELKKLVRATLKNRQGWR